MNFFTEEILKFYLKNSRIFFWRKNKYNPFQILLTELFLQRTRAETVDLKAKKFVESHLDPECILNESERKLYNQIWELGLGRRRVKALQEMSKYIHDKLGGNVPEDRRDLLRIPYVGRYIANTVLCFAYDQRMEIIDSNVERVLGRYFGIEIANRKKEREDLESLAKKLLPKKKFKDYNFGLLDFAALICTGNPKCEICPLSNRCRYYNKE